MNPGTYFGLGEGIGVDFSLRCASSSSSSSSTRISATCQVQGAAFSAENVEKETLKLVFEGLAFFFGPVTKRLSRDSNWRLVLCDDLHEHPNVSAPCSVFAYPCRRLSFVAYTGLIVFLYVSIFPLFSVKRSSSLLQMSSSSSSPFIVFLPENSKTTSSGNSVQIADQTYSCQNGHAF